MDFKFGVDSFIWAEMFSEKDLWIIPKAKELGFAVSAMEVMNRRLCQAESGVLHFFHQFDAYHAAVAGQFNLFEYFLAHQPKIAIDILQFEAKGQLDRVLIDTADNDAVERVLTFNLPAVDKVHLIADQRGQIFQFSGIVLRVAVSVEDPVLRGTIEAGTQRAAIAAILRMMDNAHLVGVNAGQLIENLRGVVMATVIDDDDFMVVGQFAQGQQHRDDHAADGSSVIVGREKGGNTVRITHRYHGLDASAAHP